MLARKVVPPLVLLAAVLAFYARALDRPFTSEDFLLIRFLGEHPPWRDLAAQLTSPWLGISVVKFYRPVATLLYGAEIAAFGGRPLGYNLAHVLVHLANAALVWTIGQATVAGLAVLLVRHLLRGWRQPPGRAQSVLVDELSEVS